MSTNQITPGAALLDFTKAHERLILAIILAFVLLFGFTKALTFFANRDQVDSITSQVILRAQADANKKAADQSQQTVLQYQQLAKDLVAANVQIAAAQAQRAQVTRKQQDTDRKLPPPALADRWTTLTKTATGSVQPTAGGYQVTQETAAQTVVQLEIVPQLQADLQGEASVIANDFRQIKGLNDVVSTLHTQVDGLNVQITDQTKACASQISQVKAQARKGKLKWFEIGYVAGLATRGLVKIFAGV